VNVHFHRRAVQGKIYCCHDAAVFLTNHFGVGVAV
jgi:hypothetical protein